jgi:L-alanine-DL-glutamate epimerase-like enolase superfamily enzyme
MRVISVETYGTTQVALVRVRTDDGAEGWGQVAPYHAGASVEVLHGQVAPHALGRDPFDIAGFVDAVPERERKFHGSHLFRALAGVETALWDLRGKVEEKSVSELVGGGWRPLAAYASTMRRRASVEEEVARLSRARDELGCRAFKLKIGPGDEPPGRTERLVGSVRRSLGDDVELLVDANGCYTSQRAIAVGRMLEQHGVTHFEEPCPHWELDWTRDVTQALDVEVAGGEQDWDLRIWRTMVDTRVVDVAQPDVCYVGGLTRALRVGALAAAAGLPCMPHSANDSLVLVFTLHLMTALQLPGTYVEFPIESDAFPWSRGMYEPVPRVIDGRVDVPTGPGWGIEISPRWLERAERRITQLPS